jgi:hypothetical protein
MNGQKSELAQILQRIDQEYQAAQYGLEGLASGTSRHDFINKKLENIGKDHCRLIEMVGPDEAIALVVHAIGLSENQQQ